MFDEDPEVGQHRQPETIKRAVNGQNARGLYLSGLKACRTAAMLNQRELAARAHTYQTTINALERQNRAASLAMVRRLCEALDVGPADLCSAGPEGPPCIPFWGEKKRYQPEPKTGSDNPGTNPTSRGSARSHRGTRRRGVLLRSPRLVLGDRHRDIFLGPERAARIDPLSFALRRRIRFGLHNDSPVTSVSPLLSIGTAVSRLTGSGRVLGAEQAITVDQALRSMTLDSVYLAFEEDLKGTLREGKLGDVVVLEADPYEVSPQEIKDGPIGMTVVGSEVVYGAV